jgi:sortase B
MRGIPLFLAECALILSNTAVYVMSRSDRKKENGFGPVRILVLILAVCVLVFSGYRLAVILLDYKASNSEYEDLALQYTSPYQTDPSSSVNPAVSDSGEAGSSAPEETAPEGELIEDAEPPMTVDWASLKATNEDIIGWLYVDAEPNISYPIVRGADNEYYLHRTFRKERRYAGSIFMEWQNSADWADPNTIVYGHNMRNQSMFGRLKFLKDQSVYDANPYFWILTPDGNYRYHIFSIFIPKVGSEAYTLYSENGEDFLKWETDMQNASEVKNSVPLSRTDKTVMLSTCTSDSTSRCVVIGKCVSTSRPKRAAEQAVSADTNAEEGSTD